MGILNNFEEEIDKEWLLLMEEAKKIGLSIQEVQSFITTNSNLTSNENNTNT